MKNRTRQKFNKDFNKQLSKEEIIDRAIQSEKDIKEGRLITLAVLKMEIKNW